MKWEQFDSMLYSKLGANAAPNYLVVHLGSNDLGIVPGLEFALNVPSCVVSCCCPIPLLFGQTYCLVCICTVSRGGGGVIRHPTITLAEKHLFRYECTHLNDLGNAVLLNDFQGVWKPFY